MKITRLETIHVKPRWLIGRDPRLYGSLIVFSAWAPSFNDTIWLLR